MLSICQVLTCYNVVYVAEGVRFELTVSCETAVFKTAALGHYATPPWRWVQDSNLCDISANGLANRLLKPLGQPTVKPILPE